MLLASFLFYLFSGTLLVSACSVILAKNPVHSVLFLILGFFNGAGLCVLLNAEFIAMLLVIVYVGAVAVLFLFVVMMLDINIIEWKKGIIKHLSLGLPIALCLCVELYLIMLHSQATVTHASYAKAVSPLIEKVENTKALGLILYTDYIYPFQLAGIVLFVAMIGAIALTLRTREGGKRQSMYRQTRRNKVETLEIMDVESGKGVQIFHFNKEPM